MWSLLGRTATAIPPAVPILSCYLIVGFWFTPAFLSPQNIESMLFTVAALLPAVLGAQLLLVLGRFDLSIGATAGLSGMLAALSLGRTDSVMAAVAVGVLVGATVGSFIGLLVAYFRVDPLIATLGAMGIARSLSLVVNNGRIVASLPESFGWIVNTRWAGVPILIWACGAFAGLVALSASHSVLLRRFYAAGSNPMAAEHAGLSVKSLTLLGYALAGIGAALTGMVQVARTLSASPLIFETLAVAAITACIIGGGSLGGGRGGVIGATIGLLVVAATENLVIMLDIPEYWKEFAIGCLLLATVTWRPLYSRCRQRGTSLKHIFMKHREVKQI